MVVGLKVTTALPGGLAPLLAVQVYVEPPVAVSVVLCPLQIDGLEGVMVTLAEALTETVTTAVLLQTPLLPVTLYVVVVAGVALTVLPFAELSVAEGLQV